MKTLNVSGFFKFLWKKNSEQIEILCILERFWKKSRTGSGERRRQEGKPDEIPILCASRNPTSPFRTSSCTKVAQDGAKLAPNLVQKIDQKWGTPSDTCQVFGRSLVGCLTLPKPYQNLRNLGKNRKKNEDPTKNPQGLVSGAVFQPKRWPTWL